MKHVLNAGQALADNKVDSDKFVRMAILCRTGKWIGLHGEIEVTKEMLELVANYNNTAYSSVVNMHSYPPIQIEHERDARETQGRIDLSQAKLEVVEAKKYNPIWDGYVLVGPLRIDDEEGQKNVESGKFSKLSLSFDDEIGEIYETSFVAVEAARGSQILKKGDGSMPEELEKIKGQVTSLSAQVTQMKSKNSGAALALMNLKGGIDKRVTSLSSSIEKVVLLTQKAQVQSEFKALIRQGKITKAEYDKLDFKEFAALPKVALSALVSSYKNRTPSIDVNQYGTVAGVKASKVELSQEEYNKALAAQQKGETYKPVTLAAEDGSDKGEEDDSESLAGGDDEKEPLDMSEVLEEVAKLKAEVEELKKLSSQAGQDKEDLEKEGDK